MCLYTQISAEIDEARDEDEIRSIRNAFEGSTVDQLSDHEFRVLKDKLFRRTVEITGMGAE